MAYTTNSPLVFVDTETTGLDFRHDEIWEIAMIVRAHPHDAWDNDEEIVFQVQHNPNRAANLPLSFFKDYAGRFGKLPVIDRTKAAVDIRDITWGAVLIGCNPQFDMRMMQGLLDGQGVESHWHYRPVCVETLVAGRILAAARAEENPWHLPLPWSSETLSQMIGVNPNVYDRHTALGDARWARAQFDKAVRL